MGENRSSYRILVVKSQDLDLCRNVILKYILRKGGGGVWCGFVWFRMGKGGDL